MKQNYRLFESCKTVILKFCHYIIIGPWLIFGDKRDKNVGEKLV